MRDVKKTLVWGNPAVQILPALEIVDDTPRLGRAAGDGPEEAGLQGLRQLDRSRRNRHRLIEPGNHLSTALREGFPLETTGCRQPGNRRPAMGEKGSTGQPGGVGALDVMTLHGCTPVVVLIPWVVSGGVWPRALSGSRPHDPDSAAIVFRAAGKQLS